MAVTVLSGANEATLDVDGQTIGEIRSALAGPFNIPSGARATLNGCAATDRDRVHDGDELNFVKASASKGA